MLKIFAHLARDAKNKQGETAVDIARRKNLADIITILENPPPVLSQVVQPPPVLSQVVQPPPVHT